MSRQNNGEIELTTRSNSNSAMQESEVSTELDEEERQDSNEMIIDSTIPTTQPQNSQTQPIVNQSISQR